ncbi:leucine-rich repeat-containing protein 70 [Pseudonaja textilis]|uniref:leucine-rich repeat-containing protein 70 n=1 Tax=Pseudonaja textilis TaxID=8673 RepID=UPI000EA88ADB|nr:leucine-rich repeat-containing protein 70 [Pseudonaja textilis]
MYQLHHFESLRHIFNCLLLLMIQKDIFCCPSVCQQCIRRQVDCRNSSLSFIPNNFSQNTLFLYLSGNNISRINPNALISLQQLVVLHLDNSGIVYVYPNIFAELKKLWYLQLNNNHIKYLYPGTFEGLSNLHSLYLQNNEIDFVSEGLFGNLTSVHYLMLQNNHLRILGSRIFFGMVNLRILNLANNKISQISDRAFQHLDNLTGLHLEGNNLTCVPSTAFLVLRKLQKLSLSQNPVGSILPFAFKGLSKLEYLFLKSAKINTVNANGFSGLVSLKKLVLSDNNLVNINSHTFSLLGHLQFLYLDRNKIIDISGNTFEAIGLSLKILDLSFNNLTFLQPIVLKPLVSLTHLQANYNPWNCSCKLHRLMNWLAAASFSVKLLCQSPSSLHGRYINYASLHLFKNCFNSTNLDIFKNSKSAGIQQSFTTSLMAQNMYLTRNTVKEQLNFNANAVTSLVKASYTSAYQNLNEENSSRKSKQEQIATQTIPANLTMKENKVLFPEAVSVSFKTSLICSQQVEKLKQAFDILLSFFILACAMVFFLFYKIIKLKQKHNVQKNSDNAIEYYGFYQAGSYNVTVPQNPLGSSELDPVDLSKSTALENQAQVILFEHSAL